MIFLKIFFIPIIISSVLLLIDRLIYGANVKSIIKNIKKNHVIIRLPRIYMIIGIIDVTVFLIFIILSHYQFKETSSLWITVVFSLFIIFGIVIICVTIRWKIDVYRDKDYFVIRNFITNNIKFSECEKVKKGKNIIIVYTGNGKIRIDPYAINIDFLLSMFSKYKVQIVTD